MPPGRGLGPRGFLTDEEKKNLPVVNRALLRRILSYLKPYWLQFLLVFVTILVSAVLGLLPSIITGRIVDEALVGKNMVLLVKLLILAFVTLTGSQVISVLESYINAWISQRIIFDMKNQMYDHLQHMPHAFFTSEKQGDIITRMNTDISGVSSVISGTLSSIVSNIATVVTTLIALFTMSWQLALIGIAVMPLLILPTKRVGKKRYELLSSSQAKNDEMNQLINETLSVSGSLLVKLFTREKREYERFVAVNDEVTRLNLRERQSGRWFFVIMGLFTQLAPLLIYFAGGWFIIARADPGLTVGTITATVALVNRLYRPVESLLNIHVDFTRSLALFTRIFDYFDLKNPIVSPENGQKPEVSNGDIVYDHVAFSYSPDKPLLTDIDFTVPAGKMYAIVGPSGSGKSTVVNLIPRLYDVVGGSVSIAGGDFREESKNRSYLGKTNRPWNESDLDLVLDTKKAMGDRPVICVIRMHNPCVLSELEPFADAILVQFGVQQAALFEIIAGKREPSALLPVQLPADMKTVEEHCEDLPFDMTAYTDTAGNCYDFGFGMNWSGPIRDGRAQKYAH